MRQAPCKKTLRQEEVHAHSCTKLNVFNWLDKIEPPKGFPSCDFAEVRFKNSRKDFFWLPPDGQIEEGDIVAVEASPGHDIGIVTCVGELVRLQLKNKKPDGNTSEFKKIYRRAKLSDIEKWVASIEMEDKTMFGSREIASSLKLDMKISDVEYQGDKTKAIFYYTADERVDFRELIKCLAEKFSVRIEMRQIGMRQEASRLGGIGSCGRELCCSTWLTSFRSVSTAAARLQQLSLNPQKLAGQCSKLKCCINYENDCYLDAIKDFPSTDTLIETKKGKAFHQKTEVLRNIMWYSYKDNPGHAIPLTKERVLEIMQLNRKKILPDDLIPEMAAETKVESQSEGSGFHEDNITRFDEPQKQGKKKRGNARRRGNKFSDKKD